MTSGSVVNECTAVPTYTGMLIGLGAECLCFSVLESSVDR